MEVRSALIAAHRRTRLCIYRQQWCIHRRTGPLGDFVIPKPEFGTLGGLNGEAASVASTYLYSDISKYYTRTAIECAHILRAAPDDFHSTIRLGLRRKTRHGIVFRGRTFLFNGGSIMPVADTCEEVVFGARTESMGASSRGYIRRSR